MRIGVTIFELNGDMAKPTLFTEKKKGEELNVVCDKGEEWT